MVSRADVFVTHGGMNSIHDAIRFKVPMIVYPIEMNYDQPGNSSRVVYYKLGLRGDLDSETVEGLKRKIVEVEGFRQNFDALNTSSYTIDNFIKQLLS
jgi:UDP:flavonoid glycosyltransferase YjiC (YdhE family)